MERRSFLRTATGSLLVPPIVHDLSTRLAWAEGEFLEILAYRPDGVPVSADRLQQLYSLDLDHEPLPNPERRIEPGQVWLRPPTSAPFALALQLPVEGFGDVTLYADHQGRGFTPADFPLVLNAAFARDRLHRVNQAVAQWRRQGYGIPQAIADRLHKAEHFLQRGNQAPDRAHQVALWDQSLRESLWAGEEIALSRARQRIARTAPRPSFQFGCNAFGHPHLGATYDRYFSALFDTATVPFYWQPFEPDPGQFNDTTLDQQVAWLRAEGIQPKGHPLVWFHEIGIPDWVRPMTYDQVKTAIRQRILTITRRYGDRIPAYDVINEAHHVPWSNDLDYSPDQLIELTHLACEAAREGHPTVKRIVNSCCLWARNVAIYGPPQRSPLQYLRACLAANIDFEVIGLQLYYPDQDMFEIDRMLDRFIALGKPIHITEMATSSAPGLDEQSSLGEAQGLWHAPWSEAVQADWVEQIYTLAYSKPEIEAATWWDFSDQGTFWPFGGLLNRNQQPKAAYYRLSALKRAWGLQP
ncbi:MAG: endo-1,4-beta-xylanase [Leptolyngbya sp.]|nr:endo-1,4-beta-xylanase [Leptolyngbya sp.]